MAETNLNSNQISLNLPNNVIAYDGDGTDPYAVTTSMVDVDNLTIPSVDIPHDSSVVVVFGSVRIQQGSATSVDMSCRVVMDTDTVPNYPTSGIHIATANSATSNAAHQVSCMFIFTGVSAGVHTFKLQAQKSGGTVNLRLTQTSLIVLPLAG